MHESGGAAERRIFFGRLLTTGDRTPRLSREAWRRILAAHGDAIQQEALPAREEQAA